MGKIVAISESINFIPSIKTRLDKALSAQIELFNSIIDEAPITISDISEVFDLMRTKNIEPYHSILFFLEKLESGRMHPAIGTLLHLEKCLAFFEKKYPDSHDYDEMLKNPKSYWQLLAEISIRYFLEELGLETTAHNPTGSNSKNDYDILAVQQNIRINTDVKWIQGNVVSEHGVDLVEIKDRLIPTEIEDKVLLKTKKFIVGEKKTIPCLDEILSMYNAYKTGNPVNGVEIYKEKDGTAVIRKNNSECIEYLRVDNKLKSRFILLQSDSLSDDIIDPVVSSIKDHTRKVNNQLPTKGNDKFLNIAFLGSWEPHIHVQVQEALFGPDSERIGVEFVGNEFGIFSSSDNKSVANIDGVFYFWMYPDTFIWDRKVSFIRGAIFFPKGEFPSGANGKMLELITRHFKSEIISIPLLHS